LGADLVTTLSENQHILAELSRRPECALPRGSSFAKRCVTLSLVLSVFCLTTALVFWPVLSHLHSSLIGPPEDNMNDFWNTWYATTARNPTHFFWTSLLRFPEGTSLVYQSFDYPQIFTVVGLSQLFGTNIQTLIALQNVTLLASFPLAGLSGFYLVRHMAHSTVGGIAGGYVFAFSPWHVAQVFHHAGVSSIEFLPVFALAYLLALERRSVVWLGVAVAFYALSALCCWYYLFYGAYFIAFQILYLRIRNGAWPTGWPLLASALCIALTAAVLSPLLVPMAFATRASVYEGGGNTAVADLLGYVAFPPGHLLSGLSRAVNARFTGYSWEWTAYLGIANLGILVWLCLRTGFARTSPTFYAVLGMLVFAILASGEALHVAGMATPLHLPDAPLDKLPFFANVRIPARAIVFVYLFLSIGIGIAAETALRERKVIWRILVALAAALIFLDFYPGKDMAITQVECPKGLSVLNADGGRGFGVLNLPFGYVEENSYMLEQVCHGRPLMGGTTSREMGVTLVNHLSLKDLRRQREQLADAHVKYILLHHPRNGLYAWSRDMAPIVQFMKTYRVVYEGAGMTVLRVY
jgi:hypothetical protein